MSDLEKRAAARIPIGLRIRLRYTDRDTFISKFSANISRGGMFINTRSPKPAGTALRFELRLSDDSPIIVGEGVVRWIRPYDPKHQRRPHGMGIQFTQLSEDSRELIDEIVARKRAEGSGDTQDIPLSRRAPTASPEIATEPAPPEAAESAAPPQAGESAPVGRAEAAAALISAPLDSFDAELARALDGEVPSLESALIRARTLVAADDGDDPFAGLLGELRAPSNIGAAPPDRLATVAADPRGAPPDRRATLADDPRGAPDRAATVADDPYSAGPDRAATVADEPGARARDTMADEAAYRTVDTGPDTADMRAEPTLDEPFDVDHSVGDTTDVVPMEPMFPGSDIDD